MTAKKKNFDNGSYKSLSESDFESFKFGVERLKELETELKSLDARGFSVHEQDIRKRLKNVSEISAIEKKLYELKLKILKRQYDQLKAVKI